MSFPLINPTPRNLTERFSNLIGAFLRALSAQSNSQCPIAGPLLWLVWKRLTGISRRFAALAEKVRTGTLPAPRPPRQRPATPRPAAARPPGLSTRQPGWLQRMLPEAYHVNACHYPLQALLDDPELAALAAAAPQLGRLLRPLCAMIQHVPPLFLQLPKRPRRPRPKPAPKPKPPKFVDINHVSAVAWGNIVNPEREPMGPRPPNRIGYARARPWPKPG